MIEKEIKILLSKEQYEKIEKVFVEKEIYPNRIFTTEIWKKLMKTVN